jgi:hypothetical protein
MAWKGEIFELSLLNRMRDRTSSCGSAGVDENDMDGFIIGPLKRMDAVMSPLGVVASTSR